MRSLTCLVRYWVKLAKELSHGYCLWVDYPVQHLGGRQQCKGSSVALNSENAINSSLQSLTELQG